jgi:hypothetical protein
MFKPLTRKRISARDRRIAAIHEAGHITMARHIGLTAISAWLVEMPGAGKYEKLWIGHTRFLSPSVLKRKIPHMKFAMFAVAGAVAECCWQRTSYDETVDYDTWNEEDAMSESDWASCRCEPGNPSTQLLTTIEAVFLLFDREVGKLWPPLLSEARRLIVNSRFGNAFHAVTWSPSAADSHPPPC